MDGSEFVQFVGRKYTFPDGATMTIMEVKARDSGWWVTYETQFAGCLGRRGTMPESQFIQLYGYLFV